MSIIVRCPAPACLADSMVSRPIGPPPYRATRLPVRSPARETAWRHTANGSASAADVSGRSFGTMTHCAGTASNRLANPPCMCGVLEAEPMK